MAFLAVTNIVLSCPSPFLLEFDLVSISAVAAFPLKELFKALGLEVLSGQTFLLLLSGLLLGFSARVLTLQPSLF